MNTPHLDQIIHYTEARDLLYGNGLAKPAKAELAVLKSEYTKNVFLAKYLKIYQDNADEWGMHACDIAALRIEKAKAYILGHLIHEDVSNDLLAILRGEK